MSVTSAALLAGVAVCGCLPVRGVWYEAARGQRTIEVREPAQLPPAPIPPVAPPQTVSDPQPEDAPVELSLDEAIRTALANSEVVRVLAGITAVSSGRTVYDPAISNTEIDQARATFDPVLTVGNTFNRFEQPQPFLDPNLPLGAAIGGSRTDQHDLSVGLSKQIVTGGMVRLDVANTHSRFRQFPTPLNPQDRSSVTLSYTQPLMQGAGVGPNLAPIVIARINTERSFFQLKDAVQELVRGVIEAYWGVVFARVDVWARRQQVEQGRFALELAQANLEAGRADRGDVVQAQVALFNFRSTLVAAEANLLQREAALRNILGMPPSEPRVLVLTTPPTNARVEPKWDALLALAGERRPDLIELKLILEADAQALLRARNQARPRVDATAFYRWNGLEGFTPAGARVETGPGEFADWSMGVNFSVPLGLRRERAALRSAELVIARDRANLEQAMHQVAHELAINVRNLAQFYEQYRLFRETRRAAFENVELQYARFRTGLVKGEQNFLNVRQAITDWGNAVSAEAQALASYNTELATLERATGTILETHGVRFFEERYRSLGPLGSLGHGRDYPSAIVPGPNAPQYPDTGEPAEEFFDLQDPLREKGALEVPDLPPLPAPAPLPQPRPLPEPPPGKK